MGRIRNYNILAMIDPKIQFWLILKEHFSTGILMSILFFTNPYIMLGRKMNSPLKNVSGLVLC